MSKFIPNCAWHNFFTYYWSQMSVELAFVPRPLHALLVFFRFEKEITWWQISWSGDESIILQGRCLTICLHWVYSCCFAFSSKTQFKMCYREEFDRCKIHHIDEIASNFFCGICNSCAANWRQELSSCHWSLSFNSQLKPSVSVSVSTMAWKKHHFNRHLRPA